MSSRSGYRGYITSRPFFENRIPQHVQNLVIRDYARRRGLDFKLSATEYAMPGCYMMLEQVLEELSSLQGVIFYSLFMLPGKPDHRHRIYQRVLAAGASLHGAVEDYSLSSSKDIDRLEDVWMVQRLLPYCEVPVCA